MTNAEIMNKTRKTEKLKNLKSDTLLTSYEVGQLLQVNPSSVNKWSREGRLRAYRTAGGHRRFRADDVADMAVSAGMMLPAELHLLSCDEGSRQVPAQDSDD